MEQPDFTVEVTDFNEIANEFNARVARMVWCNVATVDAQCHPRSRIMHPIWDGPVGWIGTWGTSVRSGHQAPSLKLQHLREHPYASLAYVAEPFTPIYIDCRVEVLDDVASKTSFSDLARSHPEPYGYNPDDLFGGPDNPHFVILKLLPERIALVEFPAPPGKVFIWRPAPRGV
jgi:general stress protein 26